MSISLPPSRSFALWCFSEKLVLSPHSPAQTPHLLRTHATSDISLTWSITTTYNNPSPTHPPSHRALRQLFMWTLHIPFVTQPSPNPSAPSISTLAVPTGTKSKQRRGGWKDKMSYYYDDDIYWTVFVFFLSHFYCVFADVWLRWLSQMLRWSWEVMLCYTPVNHQFKDQSLVLQRCFHHHNNPPRPRALVFCIPDHVEVVH